MTTLENQSRWQTVHPMFEQPQGWLRSSLPKIMSYNTPLKNMADENLPTILDRLEREKDQRWTETVGLPPQDTKMTIMVPIHNEKRCLSSFLGALAMADVPEKCQFQFVFVLNGCTDNNISRRIVEDFFQNIGEVETFTHSFTFPDKNVQKTAQRTKRGNISYLLFETPTGSKSNAMNIGNTLALIRNDRFCMSIDANNWLEPDTIREMVATINKEMGNAESSTVIIDGETRIDRTDRSNIVRAKFTGPTHLTTLKRENGVVGWCMAWDTKWLKDIGGVPYIGGNDYTLGLFARAKSQKIAHSKAKIWGHNTIKLSDNLKARARFVREHIQLLSLLRNEQPLLYPVIKQIIEDDMYYMRPLPARIREIIRVLTHYPKDSHKDIAKFLLQEVAIIMGKRQYKKNPNNISWDPLSTK